MKAYVFLVVLAVVVQLCRSAPTPDDQHADAKSTPSVTAADTVDPAADNTPAAVTEVKAAETPAAPTAKTEGQPA
ncbi:unnamed protein product [Leptidea sinapis]|uniref:Secreted protein n=1 Tax=Leptidea sinapis TaxID=189913 RepID=A0A5E4QPE8_9NEOP|nr:unnamed protein product [Leptidea sinapis]